MMNRTRSQEGKGQVIALVVIVVIIAAGYVALDRYGAGQKDVLTVETRGLQMISALTRYKQETGSYPDSLDKLVPKYAPAMSKCPNGASIGYRLAGGEYALSCDNVVFRQKSYGYDSRAKVWGG
jgi:hypothetical protein